MHTLRGSNWISQTHTHPFLMLHHSWGNIDRALLFALVSLCCPPASFSCSPSSLCLHLHFSLHLLIHLSIPSPPPPSLMPPLSPPPYISFLIFPMSPSPCLSLSCALSFPSFSIFLPLCICVEIYETVWVVKIERKHWLHNSLLMWEK